MSVRSRWLVAAIAMLSGLLAYWTMDPGAPSLAEQAIDAKLATAASEVVASSAEVDRQAVALPDPSEHRSIDATELDASLAPAPARRTSVRGLVVNVTGAPVGGVTVRRSRLAGLMPNGKIGAPADDAWSVAADAFGRFEAEGEAPFVLSVHDDQHATLYQGYVGLATEDVLIVVALRIPLGGVVVDHAGAPIEAVRVTMAASAPMPSHNLTHSRLVTPEARSDALGLFRFEHAVAVPEATLLFQAPGLAAKIVPVPTGGDAAMTVVLSNEAETIDMITGQVVLADGRPAIGAFVSTGFLASATDAQGCFVINLESWLAVGIDEALPTVVTAVMPGLLPASQSLPSIREARASGWPKSIVLKLLDPPMTISGIVVDAQGEPIADVLVEPADMTAFGVVPHPNVPGFGGIPKTQEQLAGGDAVLTDKSGRFVLKGLLDRSYTIRALQRPSLLCVNSAPVAAGSTDVVLVLERSRLGTISGRVLDHNSQGIGGVRVAVSCERTSELVIGRSATSAADGSFAIDDVTTAPAFLRIEGAAIVPELFHQLSPNDDPGKLILRVGLRRRLQVVWGPQQRKGDQLFVVDDQGKDLKMMHLAGGSIGEALYLTHHQGVSEVVTTSDAARFAVVRRDGVEVLRVPLQLAADEVNLVRL